MVSTNGSTEIE